MSVNKVILIGRLGKDPELRDTASGSKIANLTLATSERRKGKDGEWAEQTEWHRVVCFGKTAENAARFLTKGRQVYVEGRSQTRKWTKDGIDRYTTEIIANQLQFLGSKGAAANSGGISPAPATTSQPAMDDDIPF